MVNDEPSQYLSCGRGEIVRVVAVDYLVAEPCMERLLLGLGGAASGGSGPSWCSASCYSSSMRAGTVRGRRLGNWTRHA